MTSKPLGPGFKVVGNKVVKDEAAIEAKLDVSTRIKRRTSQKVKFTRNPRPKGG